MPMWKLQNVGGNITFPIGKQIYDENFAGFYEGEFVEDPDDRHKAFIGLAFRNKKPSDIGYDYPLGCTTQDLWSYIDQLLSQPEHSKKRVAFVFPLAEAGYYPLPSELGGSDYCDSEEERQERKERGRQLGVEHKKDRKRSKTPKFVRPIDIANFDPKDDSKWEVAEGEAEVLSVYRWWKKCREARKLESQFSSAFISLCFSRV